MNIVSGYSNDIIQDGEPEFLRLLIIGASENCIQLILETLNKSSFKVEYDLVDTVSAMRTSLENNIRDVVIYDDSSSVFNTGDVLQVMQDKDLDLPFIIISGKEEQERALAALREGVHDYITLDQISNLVPAIIREIQHARIRMQHRLTDALLQEQKTHFQTLATISPVGIFQTDAAGKCLYVNKRWSEITGVDFDQALGKGWEYILHPDDHERVIAEWYEAVNVHMPSIKIECRLQHSDDRITWIREEALPVMDDSGQISSYVGTITDITDLKESQLALMQRTYDLNERVKEQRCLYAISSMARRPDVSQDELLNKAVMELAIAFQYPEVTAVRISFSDRVFTTDNYRETPWMLTCPIRKTSMGSGMLEIFYLEQRPNEQEGPFLTEERLLIEAVAALIADIIELNSTEENLHKLASVIEQTDDVVIITDPNGTIEYVNPSFERVSGYPAPGVLGKNPKLLKSGLHDDAFYRELWQTIGNGEVFRTVFSNRRKNGEIYYERSTITPLRNRQGSITHFVATGKDITGEKETEHRIAGLTRIHTVLSSINSTIVRVTQHQELFEEACRIAVEFGKFRMAWIGLVDKSSQIIKPVACDGHVDGFLDIIRLSTDPDKPEGQSLAGKTIRERAPVISNDLQSDPGYLYKDEALARGYCSVAMFPLEVDGVILGLFSLYSEETDFFDSEEVDLLKELSSDISFAIDHLEKTENINYLAYYDVLTGLPNRTFFFEQLNQYLKKDISDDSLGAIILVDIDRFHVINDSLGRDVGDNLLRIIAQRLKGIIKKNSILARSEVDRFVINLPGIGNVSNIVRFIEERVVKCFSQPFHVEDQNLRLTAKYGVAIYPQDGQDADTLLRNTEIALNKNKHSTEKLSFYEPNMNDRMADMLLLETKLHRAIEKKEFILHYQPQLNAKTRELTGMEALIRWNDPETGMVPPGDFIPLLEDTGLIYDVGCWVLDQAAADYNNLCDRGYRPPPIAVNISALQLQRSDFVRTIRNVLDSSEHKSFLELEITESLIMNNVEDNIKKLDAIRDMGVTTVIDDFGTGYSSLQYIAKLPIDAVKIDREFIINMTNSSDDMTLVTMIITMAHQLELRVIAEGVETEEQIKLLSLLKCDEFQGFIFSRPQPLEDIEKFMSGREIFPSG